MSIKEWVEKSPNFIRYPIKWLYGQIPLKWRYNQVFQETYDFLQKSQWWSKKRLKKYQLQQLKKLLRHAYKNVPYYRQVFDERRLKPRDIKTLKDLRKLPYLTKDAIQKNLQNLTAQNYPKSKLEYITTGGSTGKPLGIYYEKGKSVPTEQAFILNLWTRTGYEIGARSIILRGDVVPDIKKGGISKYDPVNKNLILSSHHITDKTLSSYIQKIRDFKPDFIQAYPSSIIILAKYMANHKIKSIPGIKAVLCASENLYPWQREFLTQIFDCQVFSWYGLTEQIILAGECEKNQSFHIFPEYSIVELIGKNNQPITQENKIGEIVGTSLNNFIMPLIRYRSGDLAILSLKKCRCGRNYPLLKRVVGRLQEFVITKNNTLIPLGPAVFGIHDTKWTRIKRIQFVQKKPGKLKIKIIINPTYSKIDVKNYVIKLFKERFNQKFDISIEFVKKIPLTGRGKHSLLIQKLPIKLINKNWSKTKHYE